MKDHWRCSTCRKVVVPKNGKLSCCGITETLNDAEAARRIFRKSVAKQVNKIFDPVIAVERPDAEWENPHEDPYDYEGIPNT